MPAQDISGEVERERTPVQGWFLIAATCWLTFVFTHDMWRIDDPVSRALDIVANTIVAAGICASIYRDRIAK